MCHNDKNDLIKAVFGSFAVIDVETLEEVDEVIGWHYEVIITDEVSKCEPFNRSMPLTNMYIKRCEMEVIGNIFDNLELLKGDDYKMSCIYGIEQSCSGCRICQSKEEQNTEIHNNDTSNKKVILVIDMPESCLKCPMLYGANECILQDKDANFSDDTWDELRESCPLKELPKKKEVCGKYPQEGGVNG